MDIDERASTITDRSLSRMGGDVLFAKTDEMSVLFYASLPLEVKQILRVSGTSTNTKFVISGHVYLSRLQS